jgi:uncharacterized low-complexity protein
MYRLASLAAAAAASVLLISAASAQPARGYYAATPSAASAKTSFITRNTIWKCTDGICTANQANSQPAVMCGLAVQRIGALSAFSANGVAFDQAALAKCNARAK